MTDEGILEALRLRGVVVSTNAKTGKRELRHGPTDTYLGYVEEKADGTIRLWNYLPAMGFCRPVRDAAAFARHARRRLREGRVNTKRSAAHQGARRAPRSRD